MGSELFISACVCVGKSPFVSFVVLLLDVETAFSDVVSIKSLELRRSYDDESGC